MNYTVMSKPAIQYLCSVINQVVSLPTDVINNINLADNLTFSNIHIKNLIDQCLIDANDYADQVVNALTHLVAEKIDFEPTLDNTTDKLNTLLLYSKNNDNNYTQYLRLTNELLNLGDTSLSLTDYLKITDAASTYTKLTDFKTLSDEVAGIKTKIGTETLTTTATTLTGAINEVAGKSQIVTLTKAEYEALADKDSETYYVITDDTDNVVVSTTINSASTNDEIPTSKAVYDKVESITIKKTTYGSPCVIEDVLETYTPDVDVVFAGTTSGELVNLTGIQLFCIEYRQVGNLYLQRAYSAINGSLVACRSKNWWDATWSKWQKVCTTSVADVPVTNVPLNDGYSGTVSYSVKNGYCLVAIENLKIPSTAISGSLISAATLPKNINAAWSGITALLTGNPVLIVVGSDGELSHHAFNPDSMYFGQYMYQVAE